MDCIGPDTAPDGYNPPTALRPETPKEPSLRDPTMTSRKGILTTLILVLVAAVAAWSKLRFVGQDGYDAPQRWRVEEFAIPKAAPVPTAQTAPEGAARQPAMGH